MPTPHQLEEHDQETPQVRRVVMYLREPVEGETNRTGIVPSIDQQRLLCRYMATALPAEVIGEMTDLRRYSPYRPGLRKVLAAARCNERVDYLIVSSWDRLADTADGALEIAWHLAFVGTVVVPADVESEFPWTVKTPPS